MMHRRTFGTRALLLVVLCASCSGEPLVADADGGGEGTASGLSTGSSDTSGPGSATTGKRDGSSSSSEGGTTTAMTSESTAVATGTTGTEDYCALDCTDAEPDTCVEPLSTCDNSDQPCPETHHYEKGGYVQGDRASATCQFTNIRDGVPGFYAFRVGFDSDPSNKPDETRAEIFVLADGTVESVHRIYNSEYTWRVVRTSPRGFAVGLEEFVGCSAAAEDLSDSALLRCIISAARSGADCTPWDDTSFCQGPGAPGTGPARSVPGTLDP